MNLRAHLPCDHRVTGGSAKHLPSAGPQRLCMGHLLCTGSHGSHTEPQEQRMRMEVVNTEPRMRPSLHGNQSWSFRSMSVFPGFCPPQGPTSSSAKTQFLGRAVSVQSLAPALACPLLSHGRVFRQFRCFCRYTSHCWDGAVQRELSLSSHFREGCCSI